MTVMMVVLFALNYGNHAPVRSLADGVFELDSSVVDTEVVQKPFFHVTQNAFAHRRGNIGDGDVAGERVCLRSDAPDVEVMNVVDPLD
jgi:hypothetical protein